MKKALILANGDAPTLSKISFLQNNGHNFLVCADGGANSAKKLGIIPNLIIGDLDSITEENKEYFKNKSELIYVSSQNDTDVEKALKYLIKNKFKEVIILGGTGNRLDHTICNLGIVLKFFDKIKISILHKKSFLQACAKNISFRTMAGEIISIYAFDKATKISSNGLRYPLKNVSLPFGEKESTSNVATGNEVKIKVENGIIFIIRDFNMIKKNDLF